MTGLIVGFLIGIFVGVAGAIIYRNNEKRAWKYAIATLSEAKAKIEADAAAAKIKIVADMSNANHKIVADVSARFTEATKELKQSYVNALTEVLTKPEAELKAAIEALLAKAKSII